MKRVKEFWKGIRAEMKRISWPDRKKLFKDTTVVMVSALILGGILTGAGRVCEAVIGSLL